MFCATLLSSIFPLYSLHFVSDLRYNCNSLKYDFKDKSVKKVSLMLAVPSYGAALSEGNTMYTIAQNNKLVQQHTLPNPEELPKVSSPLNAYIC